MEPIILPRISDERPLVSVVSITYNHEPYIRDCLEGFLMQKTDFPFEVIIHDDASPDHTADIIREYYEKRPDMFHVIIERENLYSQHKPIVRPLFDQAKGKYIALCEGDDYWTDPLKLQKQFDFLEKNNEYIAIVHRYEVINKKGVCQDIKTFGDYDEEQAGHYTLNDFEKDIGLPSQNGSLLFRNIFSVNSPNHSTYPDQLTNNKSPGDMKLFLFLLLNGDLYRMKETMSKYRYVRELGGNSWSSRMITKCDPYQTWKNLLDLELAGECYNKRLDFKARKLEIEGSFFIVTIKKRSLSYLICFIKYLLLQDGALIHFPKAFISTCLIFVKMKKK